MEPINQLAELMFDSSDEDEEGFPPIQHQVFDLGDDDYDVVRVVEPVIAGIQRIEHVKIMNYVEHIARRYIEKDFIMQFRLNRVVTYELIAQFTTSEIFITLRDAAGYEPITPEKHILCYLWFVGHQSASYRDVADRFGITLSALHKVITRVTEFLMSMAPNIIRFPTPQEKEITKRYYLNEKGFPGIIGSIDGSHIRIDKPSEDKDSYINRKQYFSIQLQGVVDHRMKFIDVFIGYPGSVHDARVFRESPLSNSLQELCGDDGYLLADSAYPCLKRMIVPYRDNGHLTRAQTQFNRRLSSCRVVIENAFGCLKQRFRQLYHLKLRNIVRMVQVVHACCVLHNLANAEDLRIFEPQMNDEYPDPDARYMRFDDEVIHDNQQGRIIRDELCRQLAMQ